MRSLTSDIKCSSGSPFFFTFSFCLLPPCTHTLLPAHHVAIQDRSPAALGTEGPLAMLLHQRGGGALAGEQRGGRPDAGDGYRHHAGETARARRTVCSGPVKPEPIPEAAVLSSNEICWLW